MYQLENCMEVLVKQMFDEGAMTVKESKHHEKL